jgi:monoamine oxidase
MARTPLLGAVQDAVANVAAEERRTSRREFLKESALAGAAVTAFGSLATNARAAAPAGTTVIVGAGLAGLTAAYRLKQAGVVAQVHEASTRIGGRCWSGTLGGQVYEHGGELIDQGHNQIRNLAQELGLKLDNLVQAETNGTEQTNWFDGGRYSYEEATDDIKAAWQKIHMDASAASYPTLFDLSTPRGRELDRMSIVDWINETFEGGIESRIGQLLDVAYNIEYGAESSVQSSLNLLYLLAYSGQGQLRIFGKSNEKFHVRGGNDRIPAALAQRLSGQITLGSELAAIRVTAAGRWELTFHQSSGNKVVTADRVVLAIPFSILRSRVSFSRAGFEPLKVTAIREQGMGTNSKMHLQFANRNWRDLGYNGETFSDLGYQNTWEVTRAQPGTTGILVNYTGGDYGTTFGSATPPEALAQRFLAQVAPVLPNLQWNRNVAVDSWPDYEWTRGSYSYWKVGQYTKFAGIERVRQGTCHFAGEHTSIDFQGYLNGAVETGQRAAGEILADLK